MTHLVGSTSEPLDRFVRPARVIPTQAQRVHPVHRVVPGVGVGLAGLGYVRIHCQELARGRIVVTPY